MPLKKVRKNNREQERPRGRIKEKVAEVLELPKDVALNVPRLTMIGTNNLIIENYKGIIQYERDKIRVNTSIGIISITGDGMIIREITSEDIMVEGEINTLGFMK